MTSEERLFAKFEKCRFLVLGFDPPEFKLLKAWLYGKHLTNLTEVATADAAWEKVELSAFHLVLLNVDRAGNDHLLNKLVDSNRFVHTPILSFSRSPEAYAHSYAKRNMVGRFLKLPLNIGEVEKTVIALMQEGTVEKSGISRLAGTLFYYAEGCKALENGELEKAKEELRLCLKEAPRFLDGYLRMGETLTAVKDYETSIRVLNKASELFPDNSKVHFLIGQAELERDHRDKAVEAFDHAIQQEPKNVKMIMDIGNLFLEKNLIDDALRYFNMARERSPEFAYAYNRIGIALSRAGPFEEAESTYAKALEIDKEDAGVYFNIGMMWHRRQNRDKAVEYFKKCLEFDPGMAPAKEMLKKI